MAPFQVGDLRSPCILHWCGGDAGILDVPTVHSFLVFFQTLNIALKRTILLSECVVFIIQFHHATLALVDEC